ncbi:MAG: protein kinase [Acidobacteriota bacterium]|jgi:hypothetical protein
MTLSPEERFGPYTLISPLGEGCMGEVWKARDTRLDRTVALKVSKADFNERFEREARAIAALNHPNICTSYDVGPNYLVMEPIEGEPLRGPLPSSLLATGKLGCESGHQMARPRSCFPEPKVLHIPSGPRTISPLPFSRQASYSELRSPGWSAADDLRRRRGTWRSMDERPPHPVWITGGRLVRGP